MTGTRATKGASSIARVGQVVRVVRAEGLAAVRDRLWDRARDAAVRARCVRDTRSPWPAASVLNVIGVPMTTVFGGVPLQLRARLRRESMLRPVALLSREAVRPDVGPGGASGGATATTAAGGWRLESWADGRPHRAMTFPAGNWDGDPLRDDPAWRHAVSTCVGLVHARAIHIENAAGLSLVSLAALMGIGVPTNAPSVPVVLSVHDLSLVSRHPHGLHTHADFHEPSVDDRQRFDHAFHHALGTGILRAAAFTIYPSQFMRHRIEALPHLPAHVVAPGIEPPALASRSARRPDRIALLGGGQEHKGGPRLARLAAALVARGMHVTSYGGYGHDNLLALRRVAGVHVRGYYSAGSLSRLLARQQASVALILSTVPESFSLVLSEAWAAGVPVIAPASGAFVERLRAERLPAEFLGTERPRADRMHDEVGAREREHDREPPPEHAGPGGLLLSEDPSDDEIVEAVERARRMSWDALSAPPTAAQAAERHVSLYRAAGFFETANAREELDDAASRS